FLMMLVGFIYWSTREGRAVKVLAVLHGFTMSATRIVGLPCAAFPVVHSIVSNGWKRVTSFGDHTVIPSEVEGSRGEIFKVTSRDPSTSLGMTGFRAPV